MRWNWLSGEQENRKQERGSTLIEGEEKKRGNLIRNSDRRCRGMKEVRFAS
jgi:hypothetical protein